MFRLSSLPGWMRRRYRPMDGIAYRQQVPSLWLIDSPSKVPKATLLTIATDLGLSCVWRSWTDLEWCKEHEFCLFTSQKPGVSRVSHEYHVCMNYHDIDVSCHSEFLFSNFVVLSSFLVIRNVTLYHIGVVPFLPSTWRWTAIAASGKLTSTQPERWL